jgi:hypothetical protein
MALRQRARLDVRRAVELVPSLAAERLDAASERARWRAIVKGATVAPESRHGAPPLTPQLAATPRAHRPCDAVDDACIFPGRDGGPSDQGSLRRRVLSPPPNVPA